MRSIRKSIVESDDDATRSSSGGGSSAATAQRQIDLSILRKPIVTAVTGFLEAFRAYEAGTDEIRKLLANECDLLYECRVCRNLFRSLTNFISHKRVYCRKLFNAAQHFHFQNDGFLDLDITTILQTEQDSQSKVKKAHVDILNKDLSSIIERLRRKQHKLSTELNVTDYYDKVNHKLTQDDLSRQQHVLQLDQVPSTKAAVFQTVRLGIVDSMRTQVDELENITSNNDTVLGSDGKAMQTLSRPQSTLPVVRGPSEQYFRPIELEKEEKVDEEQPAGYNCPECNIQFSTERTLKVHTDMRHTPSTFVYTCPSCPRTFTQPRAVIRHLSRDHKKSMRRIKLLRDSILKRRTRADEVVVKGPSRELSRLLQGSSNAPTNGSSQDDSAADGGIQGRDEAAATRAWMENLEHFDQGPMCSYCGKTFDRKAVLSTHMQTCMQKVRQTENGSVPPVPPPSSTSSSSSSSNSSSKRRSKTKEETVPAVVVAPEIKQEPLDPVASDDSNSYDVPLSTLQLRLSQEVKKNVLTIKPEELAMQEDEETSSRRKRKKPMIMLRNATDDISWETDEEVDQRVIVETEEIVTSVVQIKHEVGENDDMETLKLKKRNRKKKGDEKDEIIEKELLEKLEAGEEIVCRCLKKYNDPEQYKRHLRVYHSRQRRFWCAVCDFKGYRKVDAINHLMQEHGYQGDVEDISSLINIQPVEKVKKPTPETTPNAREQIHSIIEAVSRSCDSNRADISFVESPADNTTELLLDSTPVPMASEMVTETTISVPNPEAKKHRRSIRASRNSICIMPPEFDIFRKPKTSQDPPRDHVNPSSKRPIRNRVKPVDKDFVYDLTHLLHKEEDLDDFPLPELVLDKPSPSSAKPKSESSRPSSVNSISPSKRESLRSHAPKPVAAHLVKGAAFQMAKRQIDLGRAAFHRPPELPKERTFIPTLVTPPRRMIGFHDWPVIKKERKIGSITKQLSDIQINRRYQKRASSITSPMLPELIRDKRHTIPRRNSVFPVRQKLSPSIKILNKLNASRSAAGLAVVQLTESPAMVKCPSEEEFRELIEANLKDYRATMSQVNPNGMTVDDLSDSSADSPRKRITLMQRLQENRNKRMQEQNGTSLAIEKPSSSATLATSSSSRPFAATASTSSCSASRSVSNVAEMLHAKLKRFSSC